MNSLHINDWFTVIGGGIFSLLASWWAFRLGRKPQPVGAALESNSTTADLVKLLRDINDENNRLQVEIETMRIDHTRLTREFNQLQSKALSIEAQADSIHSQRGTF